MQKGKIAIGLLGFFLVGAFMSSAGCSSSDSGSNGEGTLDTLFIRPNADESQDVDIYFGYADSATTLGNWGNMNGGLRPCASAGAYDNNTIYRMLIRFDLSSVPSSAEVLSARLTLVPDGWYVKEDKGTVTLLAHQMLKSWKEGKGKAGCTDHPSVENADSIDGATGQDRYWTSNSSARWNEYGVALDNKDAKSVVAGRVRIPYKDSDNVNMDITDMVAGWVENSSSNEGMLIRDSAEFVGAGIGNNSNYTSFPYFYSGEAADSTVRPMLRVIIRK